MTRQQTGALIGLVVGAVLGYLFFRDDDGGNALISTALPAFLLAVAFAAIGYYTARAGAPGPSASDHTPR